MNEEMLYEDLQQEVEEEIETYKGPEIEYVPLTYKLTIKTTNGEFVVEDLSKNGTNYVSKIEVDTSQWPDIFSLTVEASDGSVEHYEYAKLIQQVKYEWDSNNYYLAFSAVSPQTIENMKLKSDVEYIAMMTDVDIE